MKRIFVLLSAITFLISSCSISKQVAQQRNTINGTWTLENVSYQAQEGIYKGVLFNDSKDICFEGSEWFFRSNNSTGSYTIAPGSLCSGGDRFIRWSVVNDQLQFKFIDEKKKDISGGFGYRLDISNLNEQSMVLKSKVNQNGQAIAVVYEFSKLPQSKPAKH